MSETTSPTVRRLFRLTLLCAALGFGIKSLVLAPLYWRLVTDVLYSDAWWLEILYQLTDGGLVDLAVFAVCYPATLYAVRYEGFKRARSLPIAFSVITLAKFFANVVVDAIMNGALPNTDDFVSADLPMILEMIGLELFQYAVVICIALFVRWRYRARIDLVESMKYVPRNKRKEYALPPEDFPFVKIYARRNALQRGALLTSLVMVLGRIMMHIVYQMALYTNYGETEGWKVLAIDFVGDVSIGVIFYLVSLLLMMKFHQAKQKKG